MYAARSACSRFSTQFFAPSRYRSSRREGSLPAAEWPQSWRPVRQQRGLGRGSPPALESGAHPLYKQALISARAEDAVLTEAFGVGWPDAPLRVLHSAVTAAEALDHEQAGEVRAAGETVPIPRFAARPPDRATRGHIEAMALYAGQSVTSAVAMTPAADVVQEVAIEAERLLRISSSELDWSS